MAGGTDEKEQRQRRATGVTFKMDEGDTDVAAKWDCAACTFRNAPGKGACEMCDTPRPGATPPSPAGGALQRMRPGANRKAMDDALLWTDDPPTSESRARLAGGGGEAKDDIEMLLSPAPVSTVKAAPTEMELKTLTPASSSEALSQRAAETASACASAAELPAEAVWQALGNLELGKRDATDWVVAARALQLLEEEMRASDETLSSGAQKLLDDVFNKLVRRALDTIDSDSNSERSWKALCKGWEEMDAALAPPPPPPPPTTTATTSTTTLPPPPPKQDQEGQGPPPAAVAGAGADVICVETTAKEEKAETSAQDPGVPPPVIKKTMCEAFGKLIASSASILVMLLRRNDMSKLDVLDTLLDPKTRRYNHPSYLYEDRSAQDWKAGPANIGAPHLHSLALARFLDDGGLAELTRVVSNVTVCSDPTVASVVASPVTRNVELLVGLCAEAPGQTVKADREQVDAFLAAALATVHAWPPEKVVSGSETLNTLIDSLHVVARASAKAGAPEDKTSPETAEPEAFVLDRVSVSALELGVRFLESNKLRYRRYGLEQLGRVAGLLTGKGRHGKAKLTLKLKELGVFEDLFGERVDEHVVSQSEELMRYTVLDRDILGRMLANTNSRAVRKLLTTTFLFPTFTEDLVVHLMTNAASRVLRRADLGAYKLIATTLAGDAYLKQSIMRKGQQAMMASLEALWALLFSGSVPLSTAKRGSLARQLPVSSAPDGAGSASPPSVASALGIGADKLRELLGAFSQAITSAPLAVHRTFADRCLRIVQGAHGGGSCSLGFFEEAPEAVRIETVDGDAVLVAYMLFQHIVLATEAADRQQLIADLDETWSLKALVLDETEQFLATSEARRALDLHLVGGVPAAVAHGGGEAGGQADDEEEEDEGDAGHFGVFGAEESDEAPEPSVGVGVGVDAAAPPVLSSLDLSACERELRERQNARLFTLSTLLRNAKDRVTLSTQDMVRLWRACCLPAPECDNGGNWTTQETFMLWLRVLSFESRDPCFDEELSKFILVELFGNELCTRTVGPKTYHCLQAHVVSVNSACGALKATHHEAVRSSMQFCNSAPPPGLQGASLEGRRVLVLFENGTMVQGRIKRYISWSNKHQIEYLNGTVEEKVLAHLNKWYLLPPGQHAVAGPAFVEEIVDTDLLGLDTVWSVALFNSEELTQVATQALHLLLSLYSSMRIACEDPDLFVEEIFDRIALVLGGEVGDARFSGLVVRRCLAYLRAYVVKVETEAFQRNEFGVPENFAMTLRGLGSGTPFTLTVSSDNRRLIHEAVVVSTSTPVLALLDWLAAKAGADRRELELRFPKARNLGAPPGDLVINMQTVGLASLVLEDLGLCGLAPAGVQATLSGAIAQDSAPKDASGVALVPYEAPTDGAAPSGEGGEEQQVQAPAEDAAGVGPVADLAILLPSGCSTLPGSLVSFSEEKCTLLLNLLEMGDDLGLHFAEVADVLASLPPCRELLLRVLKAPGRDMPGLLHGPSNWGVVYTAHLIGTVLAAGPRVERELEGRDADEAARIAGIAAKCPTFARRFESSRGPEAVLELFDKLCTAWLDAEGRPEVAFSMLIDVVARCVRLCCAKNRELPVLQSTAHALVDLVLANARALAAASGQDGGGCSCRSTFLGVETPLTAERHTVQELSLSPPSLVDELLALRPQVCSWCLSRRRLARTALVSLDTVETIVLGSTRLGSDMFGASAPRQDSCADKFVRDLLLLSPSRELRGAAFAFLERLAGSANEYKERVAQALRDAERDLEGRRLVASCGTFFELFSQFVPAEGRASVEDEHLVERMTRVLVEWPSRPKLEEEASGVYGSARRGRPFAASTRETELFVGFANALRGILERHERLLHKVSTLVLDADLYGCTTVVGALWGMVMDHTSEHPFCDSKESRSAVNQLLGTLATHDLSTGLELLARIDSFSCATPVPLKESIRGTVPDWEFDPTAHGSATSVSKGRNETGRLGLRNRGSTCYQNALLQLLFYIEPFRRAILSSPVTPPNELAVGPAERGPGGKGTRGEEIRVVVGWMCICSGVNEIDANNCHICGTAKTSKSETVTESFVVDEQPGAGGRNGGQNMEVLRQLQRTFRYMQDSRRGAYDPRPFVEACSVLKLTFPVTSQNDASEFFDKLLDNLEGSLQDTPMLPVLNDCFLGNQTRLKRCHKCGAVSVSREESFYRLELMTKDNSVEMSSLEECLDSFASPETLMGDNKVDCEPCARRTTCTFVSCLARLPRFLFIHPKRFSFDLVTMETVKLNHAIRFPTELDLFPYTRMGLAEQAAEHGEGTSDFSRLDAAAFWGQGGRPAAAELEACQKASQYRLMGVLVHRGRAGGGHYYSFQRGSGDKWFRLDDSKISRVDLDAGLAEECFGGSFERTSMNDWGTLRVETVEREHSAFMLLYEQSGEGLHEAAAEEPAEPASGTGSAAPLELAVRPLVATSSARTIVP